MSRRALAATLLIVACRPYPEPPAGGPAAEREPPPQRETPSATTDTVSTSVSAIIDSIRVAVRDSIQAATREAARAAARRDSIAAAARADSIAAAVRDSIRAATRRDSIAAAARRDSLVAQARRDSIAAAALRDSLVAAARADSIAIAARADSIAAARADSIAAALAAARAARPPESDEVEELLALGPSYIPYDVSPRVEWDTDAQAMLTKTLLPVIRSENLSARTRAMFWVLVRPDGTVAKTILQTSSGNVAFDRSAAQVAEQLRFRPARRGDRAVATWVIRDISMIMQ